MNQKQLYFIVKISAFNKRIISGTWPSYFDFPNHTCVKIPSSTAYQILWLRSYIVILEFAWSSWNALSFTAKWGVILIWQAGVLVDKDLSVPALCQLIFLSEFLAKF